MKIRYVWKYQKFDGDLTQRVKVLQVLEEIEPYEITVDGEKKLLRGFDWVDVPVVEEE